MKQTQPDTLEGQKAAFPHLWEYFQRKWMSRDVSSSAFSLLTKKGIFPYQWCSSFDCFKSTELPPRAEFWDSLKNQHITEEEYQHAKEVWSSFKLTSFGQYNDLYLGKN